MARQWMDLPLELQMLVLEKLAQSHTHEAPQPLGLALYACVCRAWQPFFEKKIFRHFILDPSDLAYFDEIVHGPRRRYVNHIWLRIILVDLWDQPLSLIENGIKHNLDFTNAVWRLWRALSGWETQGINGNGGLTIELSARSVTDWLPTREGGYYEDDAALYYKYTKSGNLETYKSKGDVDTHFVESFHRVMAQFHIHRGVELWMAMISRLFGQSALDFNFSDLLPLFPAELPQVGVVTGFLVRRQQYRNIEPRVLAQIFKSCTRLETINFERWRQVHDESEDIWNQVLPLTFGDDLPTSLKRLTIFESSANVFHAPTMAVTNHELSRSLVKLSRRLERLSVSFLIEADEFFRYSQQLKGEWENLTHLALTSETLTSGSDIGINRLLMAAAATARRMPKLRVMEIWNGKKGNAAIFRYLSTDNITQVTWNGLWTPNLDFCVLMAWREVANQYGRQVLIFVVAPFSAEWLKSVGSVVPFLEMSKYVLHPVSAYRIMNARCLED